MDTARYGVAIDTYSARVRTGEKPSRPEEAGPEQWFEGWERDGALYEDALHLERWDQTLTLLWFDEEAIPPPAPERKR